MPTKLFSTWILAAVFISLSTLRAEDMQQYLSETQKLIREGKHEVSLERCLWFHDHVLEHEPAMYGVRLSFALSYWKQLGDAYPPALAALQKVRDEKNTLVTAGTGPTSLLHDVAAINRTLGDYPKTIELFRKVEKRDAKVAARSWNYVKEAAFQTKAYDLIKKYLPDPVVEFATIKAAYDRNLAMLGKKNFGPEFKTHTEDAFIASTTQLITLALATDNPTAAKDIQTQALAVLDAPRLREALPAK